jgi:single-strand DNA-binding protein
MQWSNHINKAQVMGNVGREPKITEFSTGKKTATFSIATTESYMDKKTGQKVEKIMWHQVRVWGWNVGTVERFVHKGTKVYVEGKMSMDEYMDENNVQCQFHYINVSGSQSNILVIQQPQALQYQNAGFMPTPEAYVPNPGYTQGPDPGFNGFNSNYPTQAPVGAPFETGPMPQGGPPPGTWQSSPPDMQAAGGMPGIPANGVAVNDPGMGAFGMPAANGATYPDPNMQTYGMPNLDMPANGMPNPNMQPYGMPNPNMQANGMPNPNMQANGMPNPNMQAYGMPNPYMQANGMPNPDMQANGMPNPNMQVNGAANPNMQANGAPAPPPQGHGSDVTFNFGDAPVETANGASAVPQNAEAAAAPSAGTPEAPAADAAAETAIGGHTDTSAGPTEDGSAAFAGVASAGPEVSENSDDEYNRCGTGA